MRHNVDNTGFRESCDSHRGSHVVGEHEERRAVRDEARAVEGDAVADSSHAVFPDTEPEVSSFGCSVLEVSEGFEECHVGRCEVGATAEETGEGFGESVETLLREVSGGVTW